MIRPSSLLEELDRCAVEDGWQSRRGMSWSLIGGINAPASRFQLTSVGNLGPELTLDRLDRRRTLLDQLEAVRQGAEDHAGRSGIDRHRAMAYGLLGSARLRQAFDLGREPDATRDLYGMTLFGQASLTARRLVEAGGRFVTVFWDECCPGGDRLGHPLGPLPSTG